MFQTPERLLMGPGPSNVYPRILTSMSRATIGHLDPVFVELMDDVKKLLQYAFKTDNKLTIPVSAPGSAGMEACFVNLVEPGDKVIVCKNGVFGGRMQENVIRTGGDAIVVEEEWGKPVDLEKVEAALQHNPDCKILAFVHAETSTGTRSDARELCALAKKYDCLSIVDTVTSLGGIELEVDGWGIDAVYSGTQKCLSCIPGLAPVSFSNRAVEVIKNRKTKPQSWFLDMNLVMGYWDDSSNKTRAYHHTAPINGIYALHEALSILKEEGLENSWNRHKLHHQALVAGLTALDVKIVVGEDYRLPQLNAVGVPNDIDEAELRANLLNKYSLEIGAGLGSLAGKVWRVGLMGNSATRNNVMLFLSAFANELRAQKYYVSNNPIAEANKIYTQQ